MRRGVSTPANLGQSSGPGQGLLEAVRVLRRSREHSVSLAVARARQRKQIRARARLIWSESKR